MKSSHLLHTVSTAAKLQLKNQEKGYIMKLFLIVILSLIISTSLLQAAAFEKEAKSRAIKVLINSDKPLTTGSNTLTLNITKNGDVIQNSTVSVKAFMPAMPGMPAMEYKADAKQIDSGTFEATVNLSMHGTWQLHIVITPDEGKKSRVKTSLNF